MMSLNMNLLFSFGFVIFMHEFIKLKDAIVIYFNNFDFVASKN